MSELQIAEEAEEMRVDREMYTANSVIDDVYCEWVKVATPNCSEAEAARDSLRRRIAGMEAEIAEALKVLGVEEPLWIGKMRFELFEQDKEPWRVAQKEANMRSNYSPGGWWRM